MVQRGHIFAIVDEVDSILIDEARTPLIISGPAAESAQLYYQFAGIVRTLRAEDDYEVDEEKRIVGADRDRHREGGDASSGVSNLYDAVSVNYVHHLTQALYAKELYRRDKDYLVAQGEVKIVDEFTGRTLDGRRWSDGLHQAVEAKERVRIKEENHTWATVTLQNYFRLYDKLSGMTGTAETEASEFASTYDLPVVPIPTNMPTGPRGQARPHLQVRGRQVQRRGRGHRRAATQTGQPVLVGTASVSKSEHLSRLLEKTGHPPRGPQRQAALPGSRDRGPGRPGRWRDGGHQHGRSRRRHHPRRATPRAWPAARPTPGASTSTPRRAPPSTRAVEAEFEKECRRGGRGGPRARWALRARQRAAREPPHRQPAAGPLRAPGGPGREPVLPVPRGRPHAPVRHRGHELGHGPGPPRRRAHRGQDGDQGHRAGPEHRRGPQRRDPARTSSSTTT